MQRTLTFPTHSISSKVITMKEGSVADIFHDVIFDSGKLYALITDTNIARLYKKELNALPQNFTLIAIPAGERSKNLSMIESLSEKLLKIGIGKKDALIGLGGGVIGDVTGLLASLYMRGVPCILIPTTLLAMCDSSIGGKNGVNTAGGKNLLGTIQQPLATIIQPRFLATLPEKELRNGLAECIKCAIMMSKKLFTIIEKNHGAILKKDLALLNTIIAQTRELKTTVVLEDSHEKSLRKILNYGHTIGHAIEKASSYAIPHGAAIAIGMHLENVAGLNKKIVQKEVVDKAKELLEAVGFQTKLPARYKKTILPYLAHDKKREGTHILMYLPARLGSAKLHEIPLHDLQSVLL